MDPDLPRPTSSDFGLVDQINAQRATRRAEIGALAAALEERYTEFLSAYHGRVRRTARGCSADITADCIALGYYYYREQQVNESWGILYEATDLEAARALYLKTCELGDADGCYFYADAHDGMGDLTDPAVVMEYAARACELGSGPGCLTLGINYDRGSYVPKDGTQAGIYLSRGCDLGEAYACESLSSLFDIEDEQLRAGYEMRACVNGGGLACEFLADDFASGEHGFAKAPDVARELLTYGCEDGSEEACKLLAKTEN